MRQGFFRDRAILVVLLHHVSNGSAVLPRAPATDLRSCEAARPPHTQELRSMRPGPDFCFSYRYHAVSKPKAKPLSYTAILSCSVLSSSLDLRLSLLSHGRARRCPGFSVPSTLTAVEHIQSPGPTIAVYAGNSSPLLPVQPKSLRCGPSSMRPLHVGNTEALHGTQRCIVLLWECKFG